MSRLTQRKLAVQLGPTYATVSRAFNGDQRVKEPTRQRVLQEAERLGFHGHALARGLRLKKSLALGVIGVSSPHTYWAGMLRAADLQTRDRGDHVILCHRRRGAGAARPVFEELPDQLLVRASCGPPAGQGTDT